MFLENNLRILTQKKKQFEKKINTEKTCLVERKQVCKIRKENT